MGFGVNKMYTLVLVTLCCFVPSVVPLTLEMKMPASEPLTLLWGIADTTAYVGKLFRYTIPSDAFQGNIVHFDITEVNKGSLPSWLTFNALNAELKGIPGPEVKGPIYLEVNVTGDDNSHVTDVFAIDILDDTIGPVTPIPSKDESAPKEIRCKRDAPQTIVSVIVDVDLNHINPGEKISLLENMASHLNLAKEMLKLMPVGNKAMFDSNALVIGPGNIKVPKTAGALMSWIVGCGQVDNNHMSTLQQMESSAGNGDMTASVGHDVVGWHVTNTRFQAKPRRRRAVTATPSIEPPTPSTVKATSSEQVASSSVVIAPSKTVDVKPTAMPETSTKPSTTSSSVIIQPSETTTSTSSSKATEVLPTKTLSMTSSETSSTKVTPSTTSTTTSSTVQTEPPTKKPTTPTTTEAKTEKPTPCPLVVHKKIPNQELIAGSIIRMKIPKDTFMDCYEDTKYDLEHTVRFSNDEKLPDGFWLQLNTRFSRPDILIMNPLNADAGSYSFKLTASNSLGKSASHNFNVVVKGKEMMTTPPNHELSMTIDTDYNKFMKSLDNRIELSNKVSRIFGEKNSNSLTVTRLEKGSVIYAWTNNSMASNDCPTDELTDLFDKMFNKDGTLTESALDSLQPYTINAAAAEPLGACTNNPDFPKRAMGVKVVTTPKPTPKVTEAKKTTSPTQKATDKPVVKTTVKPSTEKTTAAVAAAGAGGGGSDIWITTVVPAIVVVIVLIIALIIACCLYRKRRKGKMKLEEKNKFANNKGVPVIFADEYDEKPNDSTHPLILEDEKPPMPPPEYQRASSETSGNSNSTQPIEDKDIEEIEMEDTSERAPLYSPPPPVTASNNSKPPHVQSSRGPPPYVPP